LLPSAQDCPAGRIGLCLPGIFDHAAGSLSRSVNLPQLVGIPARELVAALPAAPVHVVTDAHAAAADAWAAFNCRGRLLAISLGTGVGACVLDEAIPEAIPLRVSGTSSGHFGQIDVSLPDQPVPIGPDGGRGGLEAYIGAGALRGTYGADPAAAWAAAPLTDAPWRALARALRIAHAIYRPETVALLGGFGLAIAPRLDELRALVSTELTSLAKPDWRLVGALHTHHAAVGAARLALGV
jgi:predicted NBD/HSP70 family sugar kinase